MKSQLGTAKINHSIMCPQIEIERDGETRIFTKDQCKKRGNLKQGSEGAPRVKELAKGLWEWFRVNEPLKLVNP